MVRPFSRSNRNGFKKEGISDGIKIPYGMNKEKALVIQRDMKKLRERRG
jgi:hypothetical protein